ncbi:hypothetical protein CF319_g7861 [Tilletia indica]|nr:hypothetical protein CF319_g7861 [Tilletia indica]
MPTPRLPGEIWLQIIGNVLGDTPPKDCDTIPQRTPIQEGRIMATVSPTVSAAVEIFNHRAFHTFHHNGEPTVAGSLQPWIPRSDCSMDNHMDFWNAIMGSSWPATSDLDEQVTEFDERKPYTVRSIRVDLRFPGFASTGNCVIWTKHNFHTYLTSASLLARIAPPNPRLRTLHLRLSAQADFYTLVERIIADNPRLTDIVLEDDSHPELDGLRRPVLDLHSLCNPNSTEEYAELDRFIIRAPAVQVNAIDCGTFLRRLRSTPTICFAVHEIINRKPSWLWVLEVLKNARHVERFQASTSMPMEADYRKKNYPTTPIDLPKLKHLILDLDEVDCRLLYRLHAPVLKHTQLRSRHPIGSHGDLATGHFPNLLCVTIWCPGGAVERFTALGLRKRQFTHNIPFKLLFEPQVDKAILIYVLTLGDSADLIASDTSPPCKRARTDESGPSSLSHRQQSV